ALQESRAEVVIDELTALPRRPSEMAAAAAAAATGATNANASVTRFNALNLITASADCVATQACDFNQPLDVAILGVDDQQSCETAATLLVKGRQEAIDRAMLFSSFASRGVLGRFISALMKRPRFGLVHSSTGCSIRSFSLVGITGMSLMQNRQVIFRQSLRVLATRHHKHEGAE